MIEDDERSAPLSMKPVVLAHVSDLHLPFDPRLALAQRLSKRQLSAWSWRRRRHLQSARILEALVADLHAHAPDHIAITGDTLNFSLPDEYRLAADWLGRLAPAARISLVPGNHDALVPVEDAVGLGRWRAWTRLAGDGWPFVHALGDEAVLIGLNSALPTAPLLARGRLGPDQLARLEHVLHAQAGRLRIVMLHHPVAAGAIGWRKALADADALRARLKAHGAELVLHGHARDARLDALPGPRGPIPCLCVPSSTAMPNPKDQGARWHRLCLTRETAEVRVRAWSVPDDAFVDAARYVLRLPA